MKRKLFAALVAIAVSAALFAGCAPGGSTISGEPVDAAGETEDASVKTGPGKEDTQKKTEKNEDAPGNTSGRESLAQRMAGKYSYHISSDEGDDEYYTMDIVPFGDNLYAMCGQAVEEEDGSLEVYSFWAAEFIPYDADEMTDTNGDTVTVNELNFSVMSNAGKYWNAGHKCTLMLTDDGLFCEGYDQDIGDKSSRLYVKDDRVENTFAYLKHEPAKDKDLEGLWLLDGKGADLYLEFTGSDLYMYRKDPDAEVFYVAGGCEYSDSSFEYTASTLGYGGMPLEMSCDYELSGDTLRLKFTGDDLPGRVPEDAKYSRVKDGRVHVVTMDEVEFDSESFGMYGQGSDLTELTSVEYYGVFVSSAKDRDKCDSVIEKLEKAGFDDSICVYTPDFGNLNPEPYYVVTTGLYLSESDAQKALSDVKAAGFADAYVKYAGQYIGDRFRYTTIGSGQIEVLKDGVMLRGVSLTTPYASGADALTADLFVSKDAVFDPSADTGSFGNYEDGDTPYEWIVRNYDMMNEDGERYMMNGPALSGVFEVGIKNNMVMKYYGSYWWD